MPTRVKICGITRLEDAQLAIDLGAAALGFNFYRPSPRFIEPAKAATLVLEISTLILPVGVFADEEDADKVVRVAEESGVLAVQLHGPRFPDPSGPLARYPMIRVIAVPEGANVKSVLQHSCQEPLGDVKPQALPPIGHEIDLQAGHAIPRGTIMVDTFDSELRGGTGRTFDWQSAYALGRDIKIILAGGLTPENVGEAIRKVRPFAVDVASGVESAPGIKDPAKLRAFFSAVAAADRELSQ